jgi:tetratricopeptide (TPR) repeat protein
VLKRFLLPALLFLPPVLAQENIVIPANELTHGPSPVRVTGLVDRAASQGWGSVVPALQAASQQAYETGSGYATGWYYLYRWAQMLGMPYNKALQAWIKAVEAAKVAHPNMAASYPPRPGSLSTGLERELLIAMLTNPAFSEEFFQALSAVDNPAEVLAILQKIHRQDPASFAQYPSLALALAVVYDVPPPPIWPHGQVSATLLPRKLPPPEQVFAHFTRLDRVNSTLHRLGRLPASELKFLVDLVAPANELEWARKNVSQGLDDLGKAYELVKYRKDRVTANQFDWPGANYKLAQILKEGGICVDQAYFASTAGKAKGIPTILFRGSGLDGRHAWFGYLSANQKWQLDCGRFADQKYVVGLAFDPQTWKDINDHELLFITERFRSLPTYRQSVMHAEFAKDYLQQGKVDLALKAAREAVNRDRRNLAAWNTLLQAQHALNPGLRERETILRDAVLAFQKYPDLEIAFSRLLIEVLRARKETSLADFEEQRLATKYRASRSDLSIEQAAATIIRSLQENDVATQIRVYNRVLDTQGQGQSIDFFDKVVGPFVVYLAGQGQVPAALQALDRARRTLRVEPGSQIDAELAELTTRVKSGNIPKKAPGP